MDNKTKGFLLVFLSAAGFGAMPVFARIAYRDGANMYELLTARFFIAFLVLAVYLRFRKPSRNLAPKELGGAIIMGLCGYSVASLSFFSALHRISAPLASIVLYTYPTLVTCLAMLARIERMDRIKLFALLISFSGLTLVLGSAFSSADPLGMGLALLAALLYSIYVLIGNYALKEAPLTAATMWISLSAAFGIGIVGLVSKQLTFAFGLHGWLAVAGLAIFSTVMAILLFLRGVVLVGASRASIISTLEPPITVLLAAVFLAEVLSGLQLLGGALVLGAAVLVNQKQKQSKNK